MPNEQELKECLELKNAILLLTNECDNTMVVLNAIINAMFDVASANGISACGIAAVNIGALAEFKGWGVERLMEHIKKEHL